MDFQFPVKPPSFNVMAKPIGPKCNMDCIYCYYLEKQKLFPNVTNTRLDDTLLEVFIKDYIQAQEVPIVSFVWQGGEPSMLGVEYFRKAVDIQQKHAGNKKIENSFQTNATLLTDEFCHFFNDNGFLVGVSIDGPRELHDHYRVNKQGHSTWEKVVIGIELLKKHHVEFNTLTAVHRANAKHPLEVYRFLKGIGSSFMQFLPVVERQACQGSEIDAKLVHQNFEGESQLTEWSVTPEDYGNFLVSIFDEWVRNDVGIYFVQLFDVTLANRAGVNPGLCIFSEKCGTAAVLEHNGDVYSCDHFVYDDHYLGNIRDLSVRDMMALPQQAIFGQEKKAGLTSQCRSCEFLFACHGDCPKHRFAKSADGEKGLSYLCESYKIFFSHTKPYMDYMFNELSAKRPPSNVMHWVRNMENHQMSNTIHRQ